MFNVQTTGVVVPMNRVMVDADIFPRLVVEGVGFNGSPHLMATAPFLGSEDIRLDMLDPIISPEEIAAARKFFGPEVEESPSHRAKRLEIKDIRGCRYDRQYQRRRAAR